MSSSSGDPIPISTVKYLDGYAGVSDRRTVTGISHGFTFFEF